MFFSLHIAREFKEFARTVSPSRRTYSLVQFKGLPDVRGGSSLQISVMIFSTPKKLKNMLDFGDSQDKYIHAILFGAFLISTHELRPPSLPEKRGANTPLAGAHVLQSLADPGVLK